MQLHAVLQPAPDAEAAAAAAACLQRIQDAGAMHAAAVVLGRAGAHADAKVVCVGILEALAWHAADSASSGGPAEAEAEGERLASVAAAARAVAEAVGEEVVDPRLAQAGSQFFLTLSSSSTPRVAASAAAGCSAVVRAIRTFPANVALFEARPPAQSLAVALTCEHG